MGSLRSFKVLWGPIGPHASNRGPRTSQNAVSAGAAGACATDKERGTCRRADSAASNAATRSASMASLVVPPSRSKVKFFCLHNTATMTISAIFRNLVFFLIPSLLTF